MSNSSSSSQLRRKSRRLLLSSTDQVDHTTRSNHLNETPYVRTENSFDLNTSEMGVMEISRQLRFYQNDMEFNCIESPENINSDDEVTGDSEIEQEDEEINENDSDENVFEYIHECINEMGTCIESDDNVENDMPLFDGSIITVEESLYALLNFIVKKNLSKSRVCKKYT